MIIKYFEINKLNIKKNKLILLYGTNDGLKNEFINSFLNKINVKKTIKFDEKEILVNDQIFSMKYYLNLYLMIKKLFR